MPKMTVTAPRMITNLRNDNQRKTALILNNYFYKKKKKMDSLETRKENLYIDNGAFEYVL